MCFVRVEVQIVFFGGYTLSLFTRNFKPRLVMTKFQASISVYRAAKLPPLQPATRLVIPKFRRARKLPPHTKSVPQPRHAKSPFYPSVGNAGSTLRRRSLQLGIEARERLAALIAQRERFAGQTVVVVASGGNVDASVMAEVFAAP